MSILAVAPAPATAGPRVASRSQRPNPQATLRGPRVCTLRCWRGSHPTRARVRLGSKRNIEVSPASKHRLSFGHGVRAHVVVPAKTDVSAVAVRAVRSLRRVPGLPNRGMRGVNISPETAPGAPISLRITLSRRLASHGAVIGFGPGGRDVHRLTAFGRRVDVPVIGQMSIVVLPKAKHSAWFRATFTRHMPKSPQFKLEHVLAALTSVAPHRTKSKAASLTASTAPTSAIVAANLDHYREYVAWLQAKYAHDPARSVQTVVPTWLELLHHLAVASELGLVDKDDLDKQSRDFSDYYRRMIDAWLSTLLEPCLRAADLDTALKLHRTAALTGLELATTLDDFNRCPLRLSGDISITTYQDLMSDRANGGSKVIEASTQLHVRLLATWQGLLGPAFADAGTTVDYLSTPVHSLTAVGANSSPATTSSSRTSSARTPDPSVR